MSDTSRFARRDNTDEWEARQDDTRQEPLGELAWADHPIRFAPDPNNGAGLWAVYVGEMPVHHFKKDDKPTVYMERLLRQLLAFAAAKPEASRQETAPLCDGCEEGYVMSSDVSGHHVTPSGKHSKCDTTPPADELGQLCPELEKIVESVGWDIWQESGAENGSKETIKWWLRKAMQLAVTTERQRQREEDCKAICVYCEDGDPVTNDY